jgi:hypothetical protein
LQVCLHVCIDLFGLDLIACMSLSWFVTPTHNESTPATAHVPKQPRPI